MAKITVTLSDGRQVVAPDKATAELLAELDAQAVQARAAASNSGRRDATVSIKANVLGSALPSGGTGKGNIGVYGMGRFPVTLYPAQWPKLAAELPTIAAAILRHKDQLSFRDEASKLATVAWAETLIAPAPAPAPAE